MRHPTQPTPSWIASISDDVINVADITFVSEKYKDVMVVGTLSGGQYVCPATEIPGVTERHAFDNEVTVKYVKELLDDDAGCNGGETEEASDDSDEECNGGEQEDTSCDDSEEECNGGGQGSDLDDDTLLKVYFNPRHVDAVFSQCGPPDADGDYGHCVVLACGEERRVFSRDAPVQFVKSLGMPAHCCVANFACPLLDAEQPQYVVSFRPESVTSYSDFYDVPAMGAWVDVCLKSGYLLEGAFVTGAQYATIATIHNGEDSPGEPPAKRRCLRPRE